MSINTFSRFDQSIIFIDYLIPFIQNRKMDKGQGQLLFFRGQEETNFLQILHCHKKLCDSRRHRLRVIIDNKYGDSPFSTLIPTFKSGTFLLFSNYNIIDHKLISARKLSHRLTNISFVKLVLTSAS